MIGPSGGQMRDDRRASHDPARGGVIGGGALIARRPAYKPSGSQNAGSDNSAPIVTGRIPAFMFYVEVLCPSS